MSEYGKQLDTLLDIIHTQISDGLSALSVTTEWEQGEIDRLKGYRPIPYTTGYGVGDTMNSMLHLREMNSVEATPLSSWWYERKWIKESNIIDKWRGLFTGGNGIELKLYTFPSSTFYHLGISIYSLGARQSDISRAIGLHRKIKKNYRLAQQGM